MAQRWQLWAAENYHTRHVGTELSARRQARTSGCLLVSATAIARSQALQTESTVPLLMDATSRVLVVHSAVRWRGCTVMVRKEPPVITPSPAMRCRSVMCMWRHSYIHNFRVCREQRAGPCLRAPVLAQSWRQGREVRTQLVPEAPCKHSTVHITSDALNRLPKVYTRAVCCPAASLLLPTTRHAW